MPTAIEKRLKKSLTAQKKRLEETLVLTPTENIPNPESIFDESFPSIYSLYICDSIRGKDSKIIFAGRERAIKDIIYINDYWKYLLKAKALSLRLLSGLNSHIVTFMGLKRYGNKILLLPEIAGGHYSTAAILKTLGFKIVNMAVDYDNFCIDFDKTRKLIKKEKCDYIFVDRTEGLNYEDFTDLLKGSGAYCIYDASHYLSNIISGDVKHPFDMGFDLCVSTTHKNFPGPQKAVVFSKKEDKYWESLDAALNCFISSTHATHTYSAGFVAGRKRFLKKYSKLVLENAISLEDHLFREGLPIVRRRREIPGSVHLWSNINSKRWAYKLFKDLERMNIDTNYRLLPYNLGYGIRMGTPAATVSGLNPKDTPELAFYIGDAWRKGFTQKTKNDVKDFIQRVKQNSLYPVKMDRL